MTLLELIETSAERLTQAQVCFGHGTTNARDEAAWLVLWSLDLPLDTEFVGPNSQELRPIHVAEAEECATLIEARIASRKPAAYLTREAWLQGVSFYVDERVIVPRSLIAECLVDGALDYWLSEATHAVLDLCTGNGSLAVIAAMTYPDTQVDAADISADALAVARINVDRHHLGERITLVESDGLQQLHKTYDLILCNPPYVNADSMAALPPEYRAEPAIALDGNRCGGADGMDFVRSLLQDAPRVMNPGAVLVLEIGNERHYFETAFPTLQAIWLDTSAGEDQVLLLTREALLA
ncbi:50S ribosomal protein L3 N(5)-glutamine methyltransferase [Rhodoferax lacus]|uniref:50S ribosomal protein L3 N(5)-glutamine methyltransferase n=1 Tax=Rhodoferax lacus TaxID=2184758 RepID=A0A3E1RJA3_9BURK|nr:50S ribosomal protein L3 N(5)-glutamine methyltransferase [Rhodoferax lacus]RFO98660.1 50S ribosomal protein L3 N(5)-glutamine methyltransferase [Rhodoferax lacus]